MESNFRCDCRSLQTTEILYLERSDLGQYFYYFYKRANLIAFLQSIYHCHLLFRTILVKIRFLIGERIQFLWHQLLLKHWCLLLQEKSHVYYSCSCNVEIHGGFLGNCSFFMEMALWDNNWWYYSQICF